MLSKDNKIYLQKEKKRCTKPPSFSHKAEATRGSPARPGVFITPDTGAEGFGAAGRDPDGAGTLFSRLAVPGDPCLSVRLVLLSPGRPASTFKLNISKISLCLGPHCDARRVFLKSLAPSTEETGAGGVATFPETLMVEGTLGWA